MDEYIRKEDVLDIASQYCTDVDSREMLDEIEALPAADLQPVSHWISVEDRLPEDKEPCAVVTENNGLGVSRLMGRNESEWTLFGEPVLYWMALPEPPKDGETNA